MLRLNAAYVAFIAVFQSSSFVVHASSPIQIAEQILCDLACLALDPGSQCYCNCRSGDTVASLPLGHCGVGTITPPSDDPVVTGWPQVFGNETIASTPSPISEAPPSPAAAQPGRKQVKFSVGKLSTPQFNIAELATGGQVNSGSIAVYNIVDNDGIGKGEDRYIQWGGDPKTFPDKSQWVSFVDMFNANKQIMFSSCSQFGQANDNGPEVGAIWDSIQQVAKETHVDHRFILAIIIQESGGCVRAPTSNYGVRNPGLMQDHDGDGTCNSDITGQVQNPCPTSVILTMIREGTAGTRNGDGLAQCINQSGENDVTAFYKAARLYNSGSWAGCAECGIATHCYVSDIVNRLTGWVTAPHDCTFDG